MASQGPAPGGLSPRAWCHARATARCRAVTGPLHLAGIDYRVKTVCVDGSQVALQLWDTAGQER